MAERLTFAAREIWWDSPFTFGIVPKEQFGGAVLNPWWRRLNSRHLVGLAVLRLLLRLVACARAA